MRGGAEWFSSCGNREGPSVSTSRIEDEDENENEEDGAVGTEWGLEGRRVLQRREVIIGRAGQVAEDSECDQNRESEPKPDWANPGKDWFVGGAMARSLDKTDNKDWQGRDEQGIETESCFDVAVQELMDCAQASTARAEQAGGFVKEAGWIEAGLGRIK